MALAPIALFVYNRPWHTEQTLIALENNELASESILYIFCDGPKENSSVENLNNIKKVRNLIKSKKWCYKTNIVERKKNIGLASNIVDGINKVIEEHGKIIVLEDDLITSPFFLKYCNDALLMYKDSPNVYSINGFQFPLDTNRVDTFLCPLATSSWGWATWKSRWDIFKEMIENKELIQNHPWLKARFNFAGYDYATMLDNSNSWAIKWYYSVFLRNGLGLFPTKSLVSNIGFDRSGEHIGVYSVSKKTTNEEILLLKKESIDLELYSKLLDSFTKDKVILENNDKHAIVKIKRFLQKLIK